MEDLIKFTEDKIQASIDEFTERRTRMFNVVRWFKYPIVALTAISTIVLGLQLNESWILIQKNIALVIGAIVTAFTTLMTFWNVEEYWIKNKVIELQLKSLQSNFQFENKIGITKGRVKEYISQYQAIIGQQEDLWKATLDENSEKHS